MPLDSVFFLVIGLALLLKSTDKLIESAANLARLFNVSEFVIGLTVVAVGTSLPELVSSVFAALQGSPGLATGNVVGSNIANIALVLGIAVFLGGELSLSKKVFDKDALILFGATALFFALSLDGILSRNDAILFLFLYLAYTLYLFRFRPRLRALFDFSTYLKLAYHVRNHIQVQNARVPSGALARNGLWLALGIVGLALGANWLVNGLLGLAALLGVSSEKLGLTVLALGTSLPEIAFTFTAVRRGLRSISIGNVLGSNIANILLVLGAAAFTTPLAIVADEIMLPMFYLLVSTVVFLVVLYGDWKVTRREALLLPLLYAAFLATVIT